MTRDEFEGMLIENSDEPYAAEIASVVMQELKKGHPVDTTSKLRELIEKALVRVPAADRKEAVKKSCARTFQALRIDVNSEFEVLEAFLQKLPDVLNPGGRVAVLTFHSGEDRLVKKSFKENVKAGIYSESREGCDSSFCGRMQMQQPCTFHKTPMGGQKLIQAGYVAD